MFKVVEVGAGTSSVEVWSVTAEEEEVSSAVVLGSGRAEELSWSAVEVLAS